jgi:hypothetical protein
MAAPDAESSGRGHRLGPLLAALVVWGAGVLFANSRLGLERFRGVPEAAIVRSRTDDVGHVLYTLANSVPPRSSAVVLLGSSAFREGFPEPSAMMTRLRARGVASSWLLLATSGQTLAESIALADFTSAPPGSILVIHLTPERVTTQRSDVEQELAAPGIPFLADSSVRRLAFGSGHGSRVPALLKYRTWLEHALYSRLGTEGYACAVRLHRLNLSALGCTLHALTAPAPSEPYRLFNYPPHPLQAAVKDSLARIAHFQAVMRRELDAGLAAELLADLTRREAAHGVSVLLLRLPSAPRVRDAEASLEAQFRTVERRAEAAGARVLDLSEAAFADSDFYDLHHLLPAARERIADALLRALAKPEDHAPGARR